MNITQIVVSIHEKRNHPYEFGHYDASVTYTAELEPDANHERVTLRLRDIARIHVQEECDNWIKDIEQAHKIERLENFIQATILEIGYAWEFDKRFQLSKKALNAIYELPEDLRSPWKARLRDALARAEKTAEKRAARIERQPGDV